MAGRAALPGFVALDRRVDTSLTRVLDGAPRVQFGSIEVLYWGLKPRTGTDFVLPLSSVSRDSRGHATAERVAHLLASAPLQLTRLLPPFAAVSADESGVTMVADSMGFRHLFHSDSDVTSPFLTSSALVVARRLSRSLDHDGIAVQSLLGWQLGQSTLFSGVKKLEPGAAATLSTGGVSLMRSSPVARDHLTLPDAVRRAADLLRTSLEAILDDHPDAILQLTGGMDSRLLLSAIPVGRRRGLRAMTLQIPGTDDVAIARAIAERYGIRHEVHGIANVHDVLPLSAWRHCVDEAIRLDCMADPVALAAQRIAERSFDQGVRISGLGGEVARGFYYVGKVKERTYSRADVERLASWRMFVNEAVEPGLLRPDFSSWARESANRQVYDLMRASGADWFQAADDLYLRHRMQRWAGATDTAVSDSRVVINPMLDADFIDISTSLSPSAKAGSRFLASLQMELDSDLGAIRLDGRPAPAAYADPPFWQPALNSLILSERVARKGLQRIRKGNRPPAGGAVLAAKVVEHWLAHPEILRPLTQLELIRDEWLDDVLAGRIRPRPSSVAFLTNLLVAMGASDGGDPTSSL